MGDHPTLFYLKPRLKIVQNLVDFQTLRGALADALMERARLPESLA
jgi:hypothetical protein